MNAFQRLKALFVGSKTAAPPAALPDALSPVSTETLPEIVVNDALRHVQQVAESQDEPLPHWLSSEDALRDEGVIFGLSDAEAEEKITVIRSFFKHQTADIEKEAERLSEKIGELNLFIEQKENRIEALKNRTETLEKQAPQDHNLLRTSVGLALSVGMCVGNYALIDYVLTSNFPTNHGFIAVGVVLAGMFNLFGRLSFFHEKDTSVSWRQLLEEIGLPLAAAFFVFTQALDNQSVLQSIALFLFVFFLFLFTGKLVLSNLSVIKADFGAWMNNRQLIKDRKDFSQKAEDEAFELEKEIDELRVEKWQILPDLNRAEAAIERYNSKRDSLIKLFESEFRLARSYRDKLTNKQIKNIL